MTLSEISHAAAQRATEALSRFLHQRVRITAMTAQVKNLEEILWGLDREKTVTTVHLPVTGETHGSALFVVPKLDTLRLCDALLQRPPGTTTALDSIECSAIQETGNIVAGNYLTILADTLAIPLLPGPPRLTTDMYGAIVQQIVADRIREVREGLVIELDFTIHGARITGAFLFLFDHTRCQALLDLVSASEN